MNIDIIRLCKIIFPIGYVRLYYNGIRGDQRDD